MSNNKLGLRLFRDATGEYCIEIRCKTLLHIHHMIHRFDTESDRSTFMQYHNLEAK